jgi:hypothetical protein
MATSDNTTESYVGFLINDINDALKTIVEGE